jgi:aconitate decarboxylase
MGHEAATDNPYTRGIAEFVSGLRYETIPPEVRTRVKLLMLDSLGARSTALTSSGRASCRRGSRAVDTTRTCPVWGTTYGFRRRTPRW